MNNFEEKVITLDLEDSGFQVYNNAANILKITNDQNPEIFEIDENAARTEGSPWWCLLSYVLWVLSVVVFFAACLGTTSPILLFSYWS